MLLLFIKLKKRNLRFFLSTSSHYKNINILEKNLFNGIFVNFVQYLIEPLFSFIFR